MFEEFDLPFLQKFVGLGFYEDYWSISTFLRFENTQTFFELQSLYFDFRMSLMLGLNDAVYSVVLSFLSLGKSKLF